MQSTVTGQTFGNHTSGMPPRYAFIHDNFIQLSLTQVHAIDKDAIAFIKIDVWSLNRTLAWATKELATWSWDLGLMKDLRRTQ